MNHEHTNGVIVACIVIWIIIMKKADKVMVGKNPEIEIAEAEMPSFCIKIGTIIHKNMDLTFFMRHL